MRDGARTFRETKGIDMPTGLGRQTKEALKGGLYRVFTVGQRLGVNILPNHFYCEIPDVKDLAGRTDWRKPMSMIGVAGTGIDSQLEIAREWCSGLDFPERLHDDAAERNGEGSGYGIIEADMLFAFVVRNKPRSIVQIGCGVSTEVILAAAAQAGYSPEITCIDPFPTANLKKLAQEGKIILRHEAAQVTPLAVLDALQAGDLFFVDSTHTVKVGSEVNRAILEMLPRLAPHVWVHIHDITFPYDYPRRVFGSLYLNSESTLLHAFLIGNRGFEIAVSMSMLHYAAPEQLRQLLPRYQPQGNNDGLRAPGGLHFPSSTWLRVTADNK